MTEHASGRTGSACEHCGERALELAVARVAKLEDPGFLDIFRCVACGRFASRDVAAANARRD